MAYLLVVDGDNISAKDLENFLDKYDIENVINNIGEKIIYGDILRTESKQWNNFCIKNNFRFQHCPRMKKTKNITDLHIFIESSERLFKMNYTGIIICTNDGDFSILANLWIKHQKNVIILCNKNHSQYLDFYQLVLLEGEEDSVSDNDSDNEDSYQSSEDSYQSSEEKKDTGILKKYPLILDILKDGMKRGIKTRKTWDKLVRKSYPDFMLEDLGYQSYLELYNNLK